MSTSPSRTCAACPAPMQALSARDIEVDRCSACGGMWFDMGALQRVSRRLLTVQRQPGTTTRTCPRCRVGLCPARLLEAGALEVESCPRCLGLYLDAGELEQVARRQVSLPPDDAATPHFVCVGCGRRHPRSEGRPHEGGLGCPACMRKTVARQAERRADDTATGSASDSSWGWDDALEALFEMFD